MSSTSSGGTPAGPDSGRPDACARRWRGVTDARGPEAYVARWRPTGSSSSSAPSSAATSAASATIGFVTEASAKRLVRSASPARRVSRTPSGPTIAAATAGTPAASCHVSTISSATVGSYSPCKVRPSHGRVGDHGRDGRPRRGWLRPAPRRRGARRLAHPPPRGAGDRGEPGRVPDRADPGRPGARRRAHRALLGHLRHRRELARTRRPRPRLPRGRRPRRRPAPSRAAARSTPPRSTGGRSR